MSRCRARGAPSRVARLRACVLTSALAWQASTTAISATHAMRPTMMLRAALCSKRRELGDDGVSGSLFENLRRVHLQGLHIRFLLQAGTSVFEAGGVGPHEARTIRRRKRGTTARATRTLRASARPRLLLLHPANAITPCNRCNALTAWYARGRDPSKPAMDIPTSDSSARLRVVFQVYLRWFAP